MTFAPLLQRSTPRQVLVLALLVAAVGILIEFFSGVPGFPVVPPGPIILAVAAALVATLSWRWAPAIGLIAALFITVGLIVVGDDGRLTSPGSFGPFLGTWLQLGGQVVAIFAAIVALAYAARHRV